MSTYTGDIEPVAGEPPRAVSRPLLRVSWLDVTFVHWRADPAQVAELLPAGTRPDTIDGSTYVGLVPFRMHRTGLWRLPGMPYLGSFPETNVRLYTVDNHRRRGVYFVSLDAARLLPALIGRAALRLNYAWSAMGLNRHGDTLTYTCHRRWPAVRGAGGSLSVRLGESIERPSVLEHFLTARWGLHTRVAGRTVYLPNWHPTWKLRRATVLGNSCDLLETAGIQPLESEPVSVLHSRGVPVTFGLPSRDSRSGGTR